MLNIHFSPIGPNFSNSKALQTLCNDLDTVLPKGKSQRQFFIIKDHHMRGNVKEMEMDKKSRVFHPKY
jgi:hypothetical protein